MSSNPYAAPTAAIEDISLRRAGAGEAPWFAVSLPKLAVMSVCTLGLYEVYWFYQQWVRVRRLRGESVSPGARALFAVLYCYPLFARIRDDERATGTTTLAAGAMAAGWIIPTLLWRLPPPYFWLAFFAIAFLLPVQARANAINAAAVPGYDENRRFSVWNWAAIVPGGTLVMLAVIGTFAKP